MAENKNWRARSIRRAVARRQQHEHRGRHQKDLENLADQLVRYGRTVQEGVYEKMTSQADIKVLRALVEQKITEQAEARIESWAKQQNPPLAGHRRLLQRLTGSAGPA